MEKSDPFVDTYCSDVRIPVNESVVISYITNLSNSARECPVNNPLGSQLRFSFLRAAADIFFIFYHIKERESVMLEHMKKTLPPSILVYLIALLSEFGDEFVEAFRIAEEHKMSVYLSPKTPEQVGKEIHDQLKIEKFD